MQLIECSPEHILFLTLCSSPPKSVILLSDKLSKMAELKMAKNCHFCHFRKAFAFSLIFGPFSRRFLHGTSLRGFQSTEIQIRPRSQIVFLCFWHFEFHPENWPFFTVLPYKAFRKWPKMAIVATFQNTSLTFGVISRRAF